MTLPKFVISLQQWSAYGNTGIVDEDVCSSSKFGVHCRKGLRDALLTRDIADYPESGDSVFVFDSASHAVHLFLRARGDRHTGTLTGKRRSDGAANAASATGYEC